jgi:mercuric ion transport protein
MSEHESERKNRWLTAGGFIGAILASSCCILPLVLFFMGVSGAWIGNLTVLEPYQPLFITISIVFIGAGFWLVYFKPKEQCAEGSYCSKPQSERVLKSVLWLSTFLIALALAFPFIVPVLLY